MCPRPLFLRLRFTISIGVLLATCTAAHAQSAIDGFNPGANGSVMDVAIQPDGKILVVGDFTMLGGGGAGTTPRSRIARLNVDGSVDASFDPGADGSVRVVAVQPDGKIVVGGQFTMLGGGGTGTTPRTNIGRLNSDGSLDTSFTASTNVTVFALAVQADGGILVGGGFSLLNGISRARFGRLNADGSLDTSFNPGANGSVFAFSVLPNRRILVGGNFTTIGGGGSGTTARSRIARLDPDGTVDPSFNPGANDRPNAFAVQADGKIVVVGLFTALGGGTGTTPRNRIGRLNADGSLDASFDPGADAEVFEAALQADGRIIVGGNLTMLGGGGTGTTPRAHLGRLNVNGTLDTSFNPGPNSAVLALAVQPDGGIVTGGVFTQFVGALTLARQRIARLYADGWLDADFNPGADSTVSAVALQRDGKILIGGAFQHVGGGTGTTLRNRIARLNPDGSLDAAFNPGADGEITVIAVQPDGKILVGGGFTTLAGVARARLGRLNADGTLDTGFDPGANNYIQGLAVQPDGKILVVGAFTTLGGGGTGTTTRNRIGRLNANGTLDAFNPGADFFVYAVALQPDGKILVGGDFGMLGGGGTGTTQRQRLGRLNADGTLDLGFNPGANDTVSALSVQPDGKILVGGGFTMLGGGGFGTTARSRIGRLLADGSPDTGFNPGANGFVYTLALQADGKVLAAGDFSAFGGGATVTRMRIARVEAEGGIDASFNPGADGGVYALVPQPDGKIVVGGIFSTLGGGGSGTTTRSTLGRLTNTVAGIEDLGVVASRARWLRSGAAPELARVTFETSTDGTTYVPLSAGARIAGGWQSVAFFPPPNAQLYVRARGYFAAGLNDGSASTVESIRRTYSSCPAVAPTSIPAAIVGTPYAVTFFDPNAVGPVNFGLTGTLPAGLAFSAGVLSGTPGQSGSFSITVTATEASGACTASRSFTLTVLPAPTIALSSSGVNFGAVRAATGTWTVKTPTQVVTVVQNGAGTVTWSASADQPWISVSPASGAGGGRISVSVVNTGSLPSAGAITGTITLTTIGAGNTPTLPVLLTIIPATNTAPIGSLDTPVNGQTGIAGSFAVTGWAIDDVGVSAVRVCRRGLPGEGVSPQLLCGNQPEVFIGNAVLVPGARPDIAAIFPNLPYYDRTGWGYLLLSNFLPNQGNGAYTITAYAEDYDGLVTALGATAIACANATATAPFGAIDTPEQGGVMSGAGFPNFGWVLAAQPTASGRFIPFDGSTIQVFVDSVFVSTVDSYNNARPDIQALFPGYANTDGAVGVKIFDSTTIANGVHTIFWIATDNFGAAQGIGSRYFTVSNSSLVTSVEQGFRLRQGFGGQVSPAIGAATIDGRSAAVVASADVDRLARSAAAVQVQHGFDATTVAHTIPPDAEGVRQIQTEQLARVAIELRAPSDPDETTYRGYARVGDALRALPVGSHLDEHTGEFAWAPGLAFGGAHDLVFVKSSVHGEERIDVRVIVRPPR